MIKILILAFLIIEILNQWKKKFYSVNSQKYLKKYRHYSKNDKLIKVREFLYNKNYWKT